MGALSSGKDSQCRVAAGRGLDRKGSNAAVGGRERSAMRSQGSGVIPTMSAEDVSERL